MDSTEQSCLRRVFFIFVFFKKIIFVFFLKKLQKYIFGFRFYSSIPLPSGRGSTARQVGGRDLYVNKNKKNLRRGPWREPAAPLPGGRPPAANWQGGRGAAGSLLKYKTLPLPSALSFSAHEIQRGERERGGVREVKSAKPCRIFDPNRR